MGADSDQRRIVLGLIIAAALIMTVFHASNPLTRAARDYAATVATASAGVYVTLRSINAVLSVAQETEVSGGFVVSGTIKPLKALEPIDDTIERIAGMVFFVMVTTGVVAVALGPVSAVGWGLVAVAGLLAFATRRGWPAAMVRPLGWYGLFLGLAVPLAFVAASVAADRMTATVWDRHYAVIEEITGQNEVDLARGEGGWGSLFTDTLDDAEAYQDLAMNIVARADDLILSYVAILSVFLFKILLLPALLSGGVFLILRAALRGAAVSSAA